MRETFTAALDEAFLVPHPRNPSFIVNTPDAAIVHKQRPNTTHSLKPTFFNDHTTTISYHPGTAQNARGPTMKFVIAFYEMSREFGGPEEGGWYYDAGRLARIHRTAANEIAAQRIANRANRLINHLQRNHKRPSSVNYAGGYHQALLFEVIPPEHFPRTQPAYS
jgi:hypothetical protein